MTFQHGAVGWLNVLSRIVNVGALVLTPSGDLQFASTLAHELLGWQGDGDSAPRWHEFRRTLQLDPSRFPRGAKPTRLTVDLPTGERTRFLRLELHALPDGDAGGYLVLLKDRQAADALETALLLASRMRSLVHVYRVLAHDLKAPLNAMQLTLELLADSVAQEAEPDRIGRRQRHVEVLREEFARLNRILETMLDPREPLAMAPQSFDLREIVREIVVLLAPQARSQRVELKVQLPEGAAAVEGYRDRLKQALLNIAINGLEAMPHGGRLALDMTVGEASAQVTIVDSGPGIPEELLEEIHQVYFTTKKSGSGIGLYVARLVVESHGGEIVVANAAGNGACFTVTLPLRK